MYNFLGKNLSNNNHIHEITLKTFRAEIIRLVTITIYSYMSARFYARGTLRALPSPPFCHIENCVVIIGLV